MPKKTAKRPVAAPKKLISSKRDADAMDRRDPSSRCPAPFADFRGGASWRIFRIMAEFIEGFEFLADLHKEVSIFGSARTKPNEHWYEEARKLGKMLGEDGFTMVTGGGPGIMEAANRGAQEAGGPSVGLNIELPKEQRLNPYVNRSKGFHYFFTRKVMLSASAQAYIYFPGGFGTLDEMFEMVTLIQTGKMCPLPIVLVGREYWEGLFEWVEKHLESNGYIGKGDANLVQIVDSAEEAYEAIKNSPLRPYF